MEQQSTPYLLTAPSAAVFLAVFVAPFAYFFAISFWSVDFYQLTADFTLANYRETVESYARTCGFTVLMAGSTALITLVLGFVYSYLARFRAGRWADPLLFIVLITLFGGYLMKIYAWRTILGNEGVLNSALLSIGLIDQPIAALLYSPGAIIATLVHFSLPFAILPIYSAMRGISAAEIEAARDLGASGRNILADILVPRCRNGIIAAFSFAFLITAGDYVTPLLVGGKETLIGNLIAPQFGNLFNWPLGAAMSFTMLAISIAVIGSFSLALTRWCQL